MPDHRSEAHRRRDRRAGLTERIGALVRAIRDDTDVEQAVLDLSRRNRWLTPLALAVGAIAMLLEGVRLVFSDWRLMLVQALPAMWIWLAMLDLKLHALHGRAFHVMHGGLLVAVFAAVVVITAAANFLNAVLAFSIAAPGHDVRVGVSRAREHIVPVAGSGAVLGVLLAVATVIGPRWGRPWFGLALGIVVGLMMVTYVAIPARMIGVRSTAPPRDKMIASALTGALGAVVCAPAYVLGRVGLLMIGSHVLFVLGIILLVLGLALQAGATGAVKAIKLSAALMAGRPVVAGEPPSVGSPRPASSTGSPREQAPVSRDAASR